MGMVEFHPRFVLVLRRRPFLLDDDFADKGNLALRRFFCEVCGHMWPDTSEPIAPVGIEAAEKDRNA